MNYLEEKGNIEWVVEEEYDKMSFITLGPTTRAIT